MKQTFAMKHLAACVGSAGGATDARGARRVGEFPVRLLVLSLCLLTAVVTASARDILPFGQTSKEPWEGKYFYALISSGEKPADGWAAADFDDSEWETLQGPVSTEKGSSQYWSPDYYNQKWPENRSSYWVRRHFTLESVDDLSLLSLSVLHDDECRVYLNGVQIYSANACITSTVTKQLTTAQKSALQVGDNVLAIYVCDSGAGAAFLDYGLSCTSFLDAVTSTVPVTISSTGEKQQWYATSDGAIRVDGVGASNYNSYSYLTMNFTVEKESRFRFSWFSYAYSSTHTGITIFVDGAKRFSNYNSRALLTRQMILEPGEHTVEFRDYTGTSNNSKNYSYISGISITDITDVKEISVELPSAGTLGVEVLYQADKLQDVEGLKVKGPMNATDWATIKQMTSLMILDLSEARFDALPDNAFDGMTWICKVALPEGMKTIGQYAFKGTMLQEIVVPSTVTSIGANAFAGTTLLTASFVAPSQISTIGDYAFSDCSVLRSVALGDSSALQTIGYGAFRNCSYLGRIDGIETSALKTIGSLAFWKTYSLRDFVMPNTVTGVGYYAFYASTIKTLVFSDAMTYINQSVCESCANLDSLHLPARLIRIYPRAFSSTTRLSKVELPDGLTHIGYDAFKSSGLDTLRLPLALTQLSQGAFSSCSNLKYVELPSYLGSGSYRFNPYIVSGDGIALSGRYNNYGYGYSDNNYIDHYYGFYSNFTDCPALATIVCRSATPPSISQEPFTGRSKGSVTLKVPSFAVVNYKLDNYWYQFGSIEEGDDIDYWKITAPLSLANNRRMKGRPDVDLYYGGQWTVGGNAPVEVGQLNVYVDESNPARLLNQSEAWSVDSLNVYFSVGADKWYFLTPPYDIDVRRISLADTSASCVFRYYDGAARAARGTGGSWKNVPQDSVLLAGQGYIFYCNKATTLVLPADVESDALAIFGTADVTQPLAVYETETLADKNWNYVGNPYPCFYDVYYMDFTAPLTVWTGSTYKAYSVADDNLVLRPMQSFFVQKPDAVDQIVFHKEGRQLGSAVDRPSFMPARGAEAGAARSRFDLQIADAAGQTDATRVVVNDAASEGYELERDASKFMADGVPQLLSLDAAGGSYAINERPLGDGRVRLGYCAPEAGQYTIATTRAEGEAWLYDSLTGRTVRLDGVGYTFESEATQGTDMTRFVLTLGAGGAETGIETVGAAEAGDRAGALYDLQGRRVQPQQATGRGIVIRRGGKAAVR